MCKTKNQGLDKLFDELTNYKGLIIQLTAFMFHSNNLYSDNVQNPNLFHNLIDYSIKVVLLILFSMSTIRIVLTKCKGIKELWKSLSSNKNLE